MAELTKADIKARAFLAAFRITASVTAAARAVPMDKTMHYRWLQKSERYRRAFAQAMIEAAQSLEDEAVERATIGVFEPTVYQGEFTYPMIVDQETGEVTRATSPVGLYKKSDMLLSKLMNGFMPEKYAQRVSAELSGPGGGPIPVAPSRLDALTNDELAALKELVRKIAIDEGDRGAGAQAAEAEN